MGQYLARRDDKRVEGSENQKAKNVVHVVLGGTTSPPRSPDSGEEVMIIDSIPQQIISFSDADFEGINPNHNQALVVSLDIADNEVKRILIDNGSSVNILFKHTMDRMQLGCIGVNECREDPLYGFGHNLVPIQGTLYLPVQFGTSPRQVTHMIKFYVINTASSYNVILGRPALTKLRAVTSTPHLKFKFPTPGGVGEVKGDTETASRCYGQALVMAETDPENKRKATSYHKNQSRKKHRGPAKKSPGKEVQNIETTIAQTQEPTLALAEEYLESNSQARVQKSSLIKDQAKLEPAVETETIELIEGNAERKIKIGAGLDSVFKQGLVNLLREYADVFAWSPEDMPGLRESIAMHSLDVDPRKKPVKQKRRNFAPERQQAIDEEIEKLLKADIICEIKYPEWVANVVLVKKPNRK